MPALLAAKERQPAECAVEVDGSERAVKPFYPLMTEVTVETSRQEPWTATLRIESRRDERGRWLVQDSGVFAPWKEIRIAAFFGKTRRELLSGFVQQVSASYPEDPGASFVTITCRDKSLALDRAVRHEAWGAEAPATDLQILARILREAGGGLRPHPENGRGLAGLRLLQNATDAAFLRARAAANGYELFFSGDEVYFGPSRLRAEVQDAILVYAGADTNCLRFEVAFDGHRPDAVVFLAAGEKGSAVVEEKVEPDLELLGKQAADSSRAGLAPFVWQLRLPGTVRREELKARSQGLANENSFKVKAEGELDGTLYGQVLRVGEPVAVDGVGELFGGVYYVDRVVHRFTPAGYRQSFTLLRNALGDNFESAANPLRGIR